MTFATAVWAVNGNQVDAAYARLMLQSASLGAQGVVGHLDCQVNATGPATSGIVITPGQVVVLGAEATYQGSYHGWNVGNDTTLSIGATGGSARSDMVVIRAEDPTWSGSPWGNPASGQILFPRVISGVAGGATVPPAGQSCIPLARIDMPSSTSVVQQAYIHDLRQVAVPQVIQIVLYVGGPGSPVLSTNSLSATVQWPAGATWQIQIPSWATLMTVAWSCNELLWSSGTVRGFIWPVIGSSVSAPTVTTQQTIVSIPAAEGPWRHTIGGGGMVSIPASIRGTTQTFQFAQKTDGTQTGRLSFGDHASVTATVQFQQQASLL